MSAHSIRTPSLAGDFISARAARWAIAHRRGSAPPDPAAAPAGPSNAALIAHRATPSPASEPRILRRWSIAELIARAAAGPRVVA